MDHGPSDRFFQVVGSGTDDEGESFSATANIVLYDPTLADQRDPGDPGSDPDTREALASLWLEGQTSSVSLSGTYEEDGSYEVSGSGWTFSGIADGSSTEGTFSGPAGQTGTFGGADTLQEKSGRFCGDYEVTIEDVGHASGHWNISVFGDGRAFGTTSGDFPGSKWGKASGDQVSFDLSSSESCGALEGEGTLTIKAKAVGTISNNSTISGTVSGTAEITEDCWGGPERSPCQAPSPATTVARVLTSKKYRSTISV